jgi:hypothetical protein
VAHAIAGLEAAPSISAKARHRIDLAGRSLIGTGEYVQQGRGPRRAFRLELRLRTRLSDTSVLHVCDGQYVWLFEELNNKQSLLVVDAARLERARPKSQSTAVTPTAWLSLGGLPKLIVSLQQTFDFGQVVESRLDELPVWTVEGRWNADKLVQLLPDQAPTIAQGAAPDLNGLPPNVPHRVVMHFGCDDLFPYRIEYWRTERTKEGDASREALLAVMEWYEVQIGARIDPGRFAYQIPPNLQPVDRTGEWLERLGLEDPPPAEAIRRFGERR